MKILQALRGSVLGAILGMPSAAFAQPPDLSSADRSAIQELAASYAQALAACRAEDFANLFAADDGYFASGFRGHFAGHEKLIALVQSERHCSADTAPAARPGGANAPTVELDVMADGVRGIVHLGSAEYQDEYTNTPAGWRFASRTVVIAGETAAGLDARDMLAINQLGGAELGEYYEADQSGTARLLTVGTRINVEDGKITGRAFLKGGGYNDEVYEELGPGRWRVKSSTFVPPEAH
jgi:hypothetical protein